MEPLGRAVGSRPAPPAGRALVVGLGRSGQAAAAALRARGVPVAACDGGPLGEGARAALAALGVAVAAPSDGLELLPSADWLVKSPGVPGSAPAVARARERGLPVLGELELGWRLLPNPWLAVTGSNGKTTTVEWLAHLHRAAGVPVALAGNVGTAATSLVGELPPGVVVACEASSFQLEDSLAFAPDAAALLNLAEDHLDRHGTFAAYREAKRRIFAFQPPEALAVVPEGLAALAGGEARRRTFGRGEGAGVRERDGALWWGEERLLDVAALALPGRHNVENAMAAALLALERGLPPAAVAAGLADFPGVRHRLEAVGTVDGVRYVDDSKATNVASAVVGVEAFSGGVHLILGGRGKGGGYAALRDPVAARCRAVYLVGEAAAAIGAALAGLEVPLRACGDLGRAVAEARAAARPGEVVLLSPACASLDQYPSFAARGDHFRALATGSGS